MLAINRHYLLGAMHLQMTHLKSSVKAAYTINDDLQYHKLLLHFPQRRVRLFVVVRALFPPLFSAALQTIKNVAKWPFHVVSRQYLSLKSTLHDAYAGASGHG